MQGSRKKIIKIYVWLMFGLLLCAGIALMKMSGSADVNNLMNQDRVYDFSKGEISQEQEIKKLPGKKQWNYLRIDIDDWAGVQSECRITIYNKNGKILEEQTAIVCNGKNYIELSYGKPFKYIGVAINTLQGEKVPVKKMQLRMNSIEFEKNTFFPVFIVLILVYLVLTAFPVLKIKEIKVIERALEILQYAYAIPGNYLGNRFYGKVSQKKTAVFRSVLFAMLFVSGIVMEKNGLYVEAASYKYGVLFLAILLLTIAVLSWEKQLKPGKWQGVLVESWFLLWIWVCISDFVVSKYFKFTGIVFLTVIGFFYFIWNHMKQPEQMIEDMLRGLRFTFLPMFFLILICQRSYAGIFYQSVFQNRESMALYMLVLLLAFLFGIYIEWKKAGGMQKKLFFVLNVVGGSLCTYFLYKMHIKSCTVVAGIVLVVFLALFLYFLWKEKSFVPMVMIALGVSFLFVLTVNRMGFYLPDMPGGSTTEKALIWENYVRKLSFFGNEAPYVTVRGENTLAYNGWLEMIYRYGVFVVIPYGLFLLSCLWQAVKRKEMLVTIVTVVFLTMILMRNVEMPFLHPLWFLFYLMIGKLFRKS